MIDTAQTTALKAANVDPSSALAAAFSQRANIVQMTQDAEDAVLAPKDPGGVSHDLRAALAARMARHNGLDGLAQTYLGRMNGNDHAALADPAYEASGTGDAVLIAFVDKTSKSPKDIAAADIETLRGAGIAEADIVRVCELIAFLAYQFRLIAGLKLLGGSSL